jgi:DNA-binding transcriptional ArsR family regulator
MERKNGEAILNPVRFKIIRLLVHESLSASEIAKTLNMDLKLIVFHLKKLVANGIVKNNYVQKTVQNRPVLVRYYSLTDYAKSYMREIAEFSKQFMDSPP